MTYTKPAIEGSLDLGAALQDDSFSIRKIPG